MTKIAAIFLLVLSPHNCLGFTGPPSPVARAATQLFAGQQPTTTTASLAGFMTGAVGLIGQAMAAEELEYAELPPPYVPAIFGIVLLVGVGVLTSSLGNVMDEGGCFFVASSSNEIVIGIACLTHPCLLACLLG